eukprot:UN28059
MSVLGRIKKEILIDQKNGANTEKSNDILPKLSENRYSEGQKKEMNDFYVDVFGSISLLDNSINKKIVSNRKKIEIRNNENHINSIIKKDPTKQCNILHNNLQQCYYTICVGMLLLSTSTSSYKKQYDSITKSQPKREEEEHLLDDLFKRKSPLTLKTHINFFDVYMVDRSVV